MNHLEKLLASYEDDLSKSMLLANHLSTKVPRALYDSLFENDTWMQFLPDDIVDEMQVFRVMRSRLRSTYWFNLFETFDIKNKIEFETYKEILNRHDSEEIFGIPDFTEYSTKRFLEKHNIS